MRGCRILADMPPPGDLFQEWRAADRAAHALEQQIFRAHLAFVEGEGAAPSADDQETAHKLRNTANDLFKLAMDEMNAITHSRDDGVSAITDTLDRNWAPARPR